MKLIMLGTGNATVTECYNTCFVLEDAKKYFLVDGAEESACCTSLNAPVSHGPISERFL